MAVFEHNHQWIHAISKGDKVAFKELFEYYYAPLCVYARHYVDDIDTCEDLVQDVFCSIWNNRKNLDPTFSIKNYLHTSVRNSCLNYIRSKSFQTRSNDDVYNSPNYSENMEDLLFLHELEELLAKALSKLPTEYRIAFEMSRLENRPVEEIAKQLNISTRTVERYRNKAVEILKNDLKDYLPLALMLMSIK